MLFLVCACTLVEPLLFWLFLCNIRHLLCCRNNKPYLVKCCWKAMAVSKTNLQHACGSTRPSEEAIAWQEFTVSCETSALMLLPVTSAGASVKVKQWVAVDMHSLHAY